MKESSQFTPGNKPSEKMPKWLSEVRWDSNGLVPVITQDSTTGQVLMFAWMNASALEETARTGYAVYYSRSRQKRWMKGESSGHTQRVASIRIDCDEDVILIGVEQHGGIACHTGREHCFFRELIDDRWETTLGVKRDPAEIYRDLAKEKGETGG